MCFYFVIILITVVRDLKVSCVSYVLNVLGNDVLLIINILKFEHCWNFLEYVTFHNSCSSDLVWQYFFKWERQLYISRCVNCSSHEVLNWIMQFGKWQANKITAILKYTKVYSFCLHFISIFWRVCVCVCV